LKEKTKDVITTSVLRSAPSSLLAWLDLSLLLLLAKTRGYFFFFFDEKVVTVLVMNSHEFQVVWVTFGRFELFSEGL